jgi:hypothetical protein
MAINYDEQAEILITPTTEVVPPHRFEIDFVRPEFARFADSIRAMICEAKAIEIRDEQTYESAAALSLAARKLAKEIEKKRDEYLKAPEVEKIRQFEKDLRNFCRIFTDGLKEVEAEVDRKITAYKAVIEQQRRQAELAAQRAHAELQEKLKKEAQEKGIEPVEVPAPVIPKQQGPVRTDHGSLHTRTYWEFRVVDIKKVPYELNGLPLVGVLDANVRKLINGGLREIPGLEIYPEERTVKRT